MYELGLEDHAATFKLSTFCPIPLKMHESIVPVAACYVGTAAVKCDEATVYLSLVTRV